MAVVYEVALVGRTQNQSTAPTFIEAGPVPFAALSIEVALTGYGRCDCSCAVDRLDPAVSARLIDLAASPSELVVRRTDTATPSTVVVEHTGPITAITVQNRTLTIYSPDLRYYLAGMGVVGGYTATQVDQGTIVQQLVNQHQAQTYGNFGIDTTAITPTGILRDLNIPATEPKLVNNVIDEIGLRNNGYDYYIDPTTRRLLLYSPRRGTDRSADLILDARSIATPNVAASVAAGILATDIIGTGASATGGTLTSRTSGAALTTFGRWSYPTSWQDVSQQATLDDNVNRLATDMAGQHLSLAPDLLPVTGFEVDSFQPGDILGYTYDAGLGLQQFNVRVARKRIDVSTGREILSIGLV